MIGEPVRKMLVYEDNHQLLGSFAVGAVVMKWTNPDKFKESRWLGSCVLFTL